MNRQARHRTTWDYHLILILLCLVFWVDMIGQHTTHNIHKVEDKYDRLGGVFTAKNAMVQDSTGALWIATGKGLCKYTGSDIECNVHVPEDKNSIDGNGLAYLFLDSHHLIWTAIYDEGINVFDIYGKKVYDFKYQMNVDNGLLHDRVWGMWEDDDGYIWISYFYGGLSRYDRENDQFSHFSIDDEAFLQKYRPKTVVAVLKHDAEPYTYWLATTRGLVKFNTRTQNSTTFLFEKEIEKETTESQYTWTKVSPLWCRSMCRDAQGNLWLGAFGALVKFDTKTETSEVLREVDGHILNSVPGVMTYDNDHIMLSYNAGLVLLNIHNMTLIILSNVDGANPNHYLFGRMYKSKDGCVYILSRAGEKRGMYRYCPDSDVTFDYRSNHFITNLVVTDNYVHYHRNPGQIESKHLESGKVINHTLEIENGTVIKSMFGLSGDSILVSDYFHMYEYHPNEGLAKIPELSQDDVYRHEVVFKDSDGDIWNGRQRDGLFVYNESRKETKHYNHNSDPAIVYQDYIVDFHEDDEGEIWIATEQGWSVFNKKKNTTRNYLSKNIGIDNNVNIRTINAFAQVKNGKIWIGTANNGVLEWDKKENKITNQITKDSGLRSDRIYDMKVDNESNIWLATDVGLSWYNTKTSEIKNFGKEFGIVGAIYCIDFDGRELYAGHRDGYYKVVIDSLLEYERKLLIPKITGFDLYDRSQDSLLNGTSRINLTFDQNFFTFSYGSINFFDPQLEMYQYQLVGVDQEWKNGRGDRKSGYTNVPPGKYEFKVRVKSENSEWSSPAKIMLKISPPWYKSLWFSVLVFCLLGLLIWYLISAYISRQRRELEIDRRFAQLETMILKSQMNPHFIFNSLNSIRYLFMKDEKEKGLKYITKFAKLLRTTLNHGERALVNLEDEIELTELFIQLEQLRFDDSFTFTSHYGEDHYWKEVKVPPFVIQPIVENAFWHGLLPSKKDYKALEISIKKKQGGYLIIIEDNGVGLSTESEYAVDTELNKTKSYGLSIIKERFDLMNKNEEQQYILIVEDSDRNESGAKVTIDITSK